MTHWAIRESGYSKKEILDAIDSGDVPKSGSAPLIRKDLPNLDFYIGKKVGFGTPAFKRYKQDLRNPTQPLSSWITPKSEIDTIDDGVNSVVSGTNDEGAKVIKEVFGQKAFNYAKPVSLIRELVRQATGPGDIVLDFFAGSATTAQAVMELNAEDGGDRRFIMVSSTEATTDEPDKNLCQDITAQRIRRLNGLEDKKYAKLTAEFAYLRCREILFEDLDYELSLPEAWAALEAIHDLPMTGYEAQQPWQLHENDVMALVLAPRDAPGLIEVLQALGRNKRNIFVYSTAPGQIEPYVTDLFVEVHDLHATLIKRFQA